MESLNNGKKMVPTAKLDLVGEGCEYAEHVHAFLLWIDPVEDIALKQQFFQPSGRYSDCNVHQYSVQLAEEVGPRCVCDQGKRKPTVETH